MRSIFTCNRKHWWIECFLRGVAGGRSVLMRLAKSCTIQLFLTLAVENEWRQKNSRSVIVKKTFVAIALFLFALSAAQAQKLTGAGATFPYPIYSKWFNEYSAAHAGVEIN